MASRAFGSFGIAVAKQKARRARRPVLAPVVLPPITVRLLRLIHTSDEIAEAILQSGDWSSAGTLREVVRIATAVRRRVLKLERERLSSSSCC